MPKFNLTSYQLEAVKGVINEYEHGGNSALVLMPTGTGKTVVAVEILNHLLSKYKVKNIAHVSMRKESSVQARQIFEGKLENEDSHIATYSYSELLDAISSNGLNKDSFEIVIFDGIDEFEAANANLLLYEKTLTYFNCFKVAFGRVPHSVLIGKFKLVYRHSYEQAVQDGSFFIFQKILKENYIGQLDDVIKNLREGQLLSIEEKNSLQNEVSILKKENQDFQRALKLLLDGELKKEELFEMSHRVEQLNVFEEMLASDDTEGKWQHFFEKNQWIFGLGLNYIFNAPLEGSKLEKTVAGASVSGTGKRIDALLRTTGIIQSLSFGEIKTHRTKVLKSVTNPYRVDSWAISDELAGGIAQVQRTVQKSLMNISEKLPVFDDEGCLKHSSIYLYKPKAFLIIGSLDEFKNEKGFINESKFSSFELFRRSISDIEIVTFDELYSRACALTNKRSKWL